MDHWIIVGEGRESTSLSFSSRALLNGFTRKWLTSKYSQKYASSKEVLKGLKKSSTLASRAIHSQKWSAIRILLAELHATAWSRLHNFPRTYKSESKNDIVWCWDDRQMECSVQKVAAVIFQIVKRKSTRWREHQLDALDASFSLSFGSQFDGWQTFRLNREKQNSAAYEIRRKRRIK